MRTRKLHPHRLVGVIAMNATLVEGATSSAIGAANLTTGDEAEYEAASEVAVTYAEAFYLFAWRVRGSLTQGDPLGPFDPGVSTGCSTCLSSTPSRAGHLCPPGRSPVMETLGLPRGQVNLSPHRAAAPTWRCPADRAGPQGGHRRLGDC